MFILFLALTLWASVHAQLESAEKFAYSTRDTVTVESQSTLNIILALTTATDEYLSEASVQATLQIINSASTPYPYNLLYFNYNTGEGQACYQTWVLTGGIGRQLECSTLVAQSFSLLPTCAQYVGCGLENISLTIVLDDDLYKESYLMIQNTQPQPIELSTYLFVELQSQNTWFYWGVGLTCLLLISLVIFTGIVFYWMLKYKRVKKMFEQYKLTEEASVSKQE